MADVHLSPDIDAAAARALALAVATDAALRRAVGIDGAVFDVDGTRIDTPPDDAPPPVNV